MPTVSVVIPNYNHAPYLKERIDSVLNQTFQDFEVIILDDCSPDNSREVIESYRGNPKVSHIVYNEQNSGSTFRQWEKGIKLAQGEWIWIAESDDVAERNFLEILLQNVKGKNCVVLSYCASIETDSTGNSVKQNDWAYDISDRDWTKDACNKGVDEIKTQFFYKNIIPNASAVLFKREVVDSTVFRTINAMRFAGDWLFWVKLIEKGEIFYTASSLNYFRCHEKSTREMKSVQLERKRFEECLSIIYFIRGKYKLQWNIQKHDWLVEEWKWKFYFQKDIYRYLFQTKFPFSYKMVILKRIITEKYFI